MKIRSLGLGFFALTAVFLLTSCAPQMANEVAKVRPSAERPNDTTQLPVRYQSPSFTVQPISSSAEFGDMKETVVPVGADFTSSVPVSLRDIIKQLAQMKGMNVSWANDVDQTATVDVNIRAEEDFFKSITNLLRQVDYFQEVHGNTLVIKHKAVRKYHIAMPFVASKFSTGVGGDVLGSSASGGNMKGKLELTSDGNEFDIWKNIQENLDKVLEIWEAPTPMATPAPNAEGKQQTAEKAPPAPSRPPVGKGYYTIDKPIGLITVTAPPSLLDKIDAYINNL
ncbi:MAG: type II and III secretion system protein, partial [Deltaproteobacteria bacterium]